MKIGIIDVIGLPYDGNTLKNKGIGGSESSIISISRELVKLGFSVTVLNDCTNEAAKPGIYDGVEYCPITTLAEKDFNFDIVISQRSVTPFAPKYLWDQVQRPAPWDFDQGIYNQLQRINQLKILWLQDTFCWGDHVLEHMVVHGHIDEIFTLSDWHTSYITHNQHGPRRNIEVLKSHVFQTRNAINRWIDWVDIREKDSNQYVFNASVNKGMIPLLDHIWPKVKDRLPNAKLTIIGGYYQYPGVDADDSVKKVWEFQEKFKYNNDIKFTGIITQEEIAKILAKAGWTIYPASFPETSGISTLESISYNTPVLGCRFGAMEESATELASYFIDYAIEPNGLFPNIDKDNQINKFVEMVVKAANDPYLYQQKQYACNRIKEVATWDTVALQWKQHFYEKFNVSLDKKEKDLVDYINYRVHDVFNRKFSNNCEIIVPNITHKLESFLGQNTNIAIVDIPGMSYDGSTLSRRGLGGSESAVILIAKELSKIGFNVTVFNGCDEDDSSPGIYENVTYRPIADIENDECNYDVVISSRTVMPFVTEPFYHLHFNLPRQYQYSIFKKLREKAKLKIFWMHDTFSWGDDAIEPLVLANAIDEIWCLSDFHSHYVMNCNHGSPRNYEVLKNRVWVTRNGITKYFDSVNLEDKDPNQFFFNANMSKGLAPLLNDIWPEVQQRIPEAKLIIIGGFYKLGTAFNEASSQEIEFRSIVDPHLNNPSITFTGIISQKEVADIAKKSTFFIYPASLPETYGISTLESLYAQTPLLTCRFGALEETASDSLSWMINYAIVPNGLYPHIDANRQKELFVNMVVNAYNSKDQIIRKQNNCLDIKELAGWDVVALEWKKHIFKKLGKYLSPGEHQHVQYYSAKYNKLTGRRMTSLDFWNVPKNKKERLILVVSPFYNARNYLEKCILSVAQQDYDNYEHWLINDNSTDDSLAVVHNMINSLPESIKHKFHVINNNTNIGAVGNQIEFIKNYNANPDTIIMFLDGDDWLVNKNDLFTYYNHLHDNYDFTYGSCWSEADNIPLVSQPYPPEVKQNKMYRSYKFNWNMPYTHLRTFKISVAKFLPKELFQNSKGEWYRAGGDVSTFYNIIEQVDHRRIGVVSDIVYHYNDLNPLNDYKINSDQQTQTANSIIQNSNVINSVDTKIDKDNRTKRILIAIPTNRNIEAQTFKSIYDLEVPYGYEVDFQYFWGYQVEQVRNLIAHFTIHNQYDYLFSVDSDIAFPRDTLRKLLEHNVDVVSGLYIQRIQGVHCVEVMRYNQYGGVSHVPYDEIKGQGLVPVDSCGFGCVLVKTHVLKAIPYPQFVYKSAIDHSNTISEDVYFCKQVRERGMRIYADTSILCDHIGSWTFRVE